MTLNHNYGCSNEAVAGIAGNVVAAWRSGGLIVHPFISALKIIKCTKVWVWYTAAILPNCLLVAVLYQYRYAVAQYIPLRLYWRNTVISANLTQPNTRPRTVRQCDSK